MDKQEVLKEYRKTEDRILLSQVLDKIEIAEKRNQIQYTDFLDMYQVALVKKFLNKNQLQNYILYGGFEDAERKIAIFYLDNYDKEIVEKDYQKMLKVIRVSKSLDKIFAVSSFTIISAPSSATKISPTFSLFIPSLIIPPK